MAESRFEQHHVWATEVACVAVSQNENWSWGGGYATATTNEVDAAVTRCWERLLGGHGYCDVVSITHSPVTMGDRVWFFVTVLAKLAHPKVARSDV